MFLVPYVFYGREELKTILASPPTFYTVSNMTEEQVSLRGEAVEELRKGKRGLNKFGEQMKGKNKVIGA